MAFCVQLRSSDKPWLCLCACAAYPSAYAWHGCCRVLSQQANTPLPRVFLSSFAAIVQVLLSKQGQALHLRVALALIPREGLQQPPWAVHAGAGKPSCADWSTPQSPIVLKSLRTFLLQVTASLQGATRILQRRLEPSKKLLSVLQRWPIFASNSFQLWGWRLRRMLGRCVNTSRFFLMHWRQ